MIEIKTDEIYTEEDILREGLKVTKCVGGARFPKNTFRYEKGNEIYILEEITRGKLRILAYHNLETGEVVRNDC